MIVVPKHHVNKLLRLNDVDSGGRWKPAVATERGLQAAGSPRRIVTRRRRERWNWYGITPHY
ncbi:hypothetical protein NJ7G_1920 [Natrinema sp. J7-2]|nr:hypothetical protein NJ7G_1920 [Natrinema sp. J7-2]